MQVFDLTAYQLAQLLKFPFCGILKENHCSLATKKNVPPSFSIPAILPNRGRTWLLREAAIVTSVTIFSIGRHGFWLLASELANVLVKAEWSVANS